MSEEKYRNDFDQNRFNELLAGFDDEPTYKPGKHSKEKEKKVKQYKVHWYTKLLLFVDLCAVICFFIAYGPFSFFRDWVVTTAIHTQTHGHIAYILYNDRMVDKVKLKNTESQTEKGTDTSLITFKEHDENEGYSSIYEQQILEREDGQEYKIIEINEDAYTGFLTVIYDSKRLELTMAKSANGDTIQTMAERVGATICVNGGGFGRDENTKAINSGTVIMDGEIISASDEEVNLIGMTRDGVLCLYSQIFASDALQYDLKWGVVFSPFLIVNGVPTEFTGNGGYGVQPRTAIGQREDGIILILTIDGRGANNSKGISVIGLQEIFLRYGCINAANLDGGGSTTLVENGTVINSPMGGGSTAGERHVLSAIYFK